MFEIFEISNSNFNFSKVEVAKISLNYPTRSISLFYKYSRTVFLHSDKEGLSDLFVKFASADSSRP